MTIEGHRILIQQLVIGTWIMTIVSWHTVFVVTYIVYLWYRAAPPARKCDPYRRDLITMVVALPWSYSSEDIIDDLSEGTGIQILLIEKSNGACFDAQPPKLPVRIGADCDDACFARDGLDAAGATDAIFFA